MTSRARGKRESIVVELCLRRRQSRAPDSFQITRAKRR